MYALILNNEIQSLGNPPQGARRLDTGQWVTPPAGIWTDSLLAACGWLPVTETPRPDDTDTATHDYSVELVDGTPTETWTVREWTADELAARQAATDRAALLEEIGRIDAALATEDARIQPCLDDGPQTINASPAQYIKYNARALKRVIKAARDLAAVVRDN